MEDDFTLKSFFNAVCDFYNESLKIMLNKFRSFFILPFVSLLQSFSHRCSTHYFITIIKCYLQKEWAGLMSVYIYSMVNICLTAITAKKYTIPDQETYSKRILNITIPLGFL